MNLFGGLLGQQQREVRPASRSSRLAAAGFKSRDWRLKCDECGGLFSAQMLPIHRCPVVPLLERLRGLSKTLESSGRIDEQEHPGAYATILDAMNALQGKGTSC